VARAPVAVLAVVAFGAIAALTLAGAMRGPDHFVHAAVRGLGHWDGEPPAGNDTDPDVRGRWHGDLPGAEHVGALGDWRSALGAAAVLAAALWAAGRRRSAAVALAGATANGLATAILQTAFEPLAAPLRAGAAGPYPQMFPSGHTLGALFTAGLAAGLLARRVAGAAGTRVAWCAAAGAGLLVGLARILGGQHLPSDVLAGAAAGAALLAATLAADARWGG
jgi:undecaprenyl-diphosphatase